MRWLYRGGRLDRGDFSAVPASDRGVLLGDGVFETMRTYDGALFRLDAHLARLRRSLELTGMRAAIVDDLGGVVRAALAEVAATPRRPRREASERAAPIEHYVRITVTRAGTERGPRPPRDGAIGAVLIHLDPIARDVAGHPVRAISLPSPLANGSLRTIKSTSFQPYVLALGEAARAGADEAIFHDPDGAVVEGTTSNVFARIDGALITPPLSRNILAGITRAEVIALAAASGDPVRERDISRDELPYAEELFVTSTSRELAPVVALDGAPRSGPSASTARLMTLFRERTRAR